MLNQDEIAQKFADYGVSQFRRALYWLTVFPKGASHASEVDVLEWIIG